MITSGGWYCVNRKTTGVLPRVILWACSGQVLDIQGGVAGKIFEKKLGKRVDGGGELW